MKYDGISTASHSNCSNDFLRFEKAGKLAAVDECGFDQRCAPVYAYALTAVSTPNIKHKKRVK